MASTQVVSAAVAISPAENATLDLEERLTEAKSTSEFDDRHHVFLPAGNVTALLNNDYWPIAGLSGLSVRYEHRMNKVGVTFSEYENVVARVIGNSEHDLKACFNEKSIDYSKIESDLSVWDKEVRRDASQSHDTLTECMRIQSVDLRVTERTTGPHGMSVNPVSQLNSTLGNDVCDEEDFLNLPKQKNDFVESVAVLDASDLVDLPRNDAGTVSLTDIPVVRDFWEATGCQWAARKSSLTTISKQPTKAVALDTAEILTAGESLGDSDMSTATQAAHIYDDLLPGEAAALDLTESKASTPDRSTVESRDSQIKLELAGGIYQPDRRDIWRSSGRTSLDVRYEKQIGQARYIFSNRIDAATHGLNNDSHYVNSLREAYVSWRPGGGHMINLGRENVRNGVAIGYRPTDFLRADSIRFPTTSDPNGLREMRLGTVQLRDSLFWDGGSLSIAYLPKLAGSPSNAPESVDFGATNRHHRWLTSLTQTIAPGFAPQLLLYGGQGTPVQGGINASVLVSDSTVLYGEWARGKKDRQYSEFSNSFRGRATIGFSHTTTFNMMISAEYQYNGAGRSRRQWQALNPQQRQYEVALANTRQDSPSRHAALLYLTQRGAFGVRPLTLTAMLSYNFADQNKLGWMEVRHQATSMDIAIQLQHQSNFTNSKYGVAGGGYKFNVIVTRYF
nr:hypothetical protein [Burkholderia ambifaria]